MSFFPRRPLFFSYYRALRFSPNVSGLRIRAVRGNEPANDQFSPANPMQSTSRAKHPFIC
jgi:hypothetical protein